MDIEEFLKRYFNAIKYEKYENGYEIAFPFKLYNDDRISSVFVSQDSSWLFTVTDNGNVLRCLEESGVNIKEHERKIKMICKMFNLTLKDCEVSAILGEYETNQTFTQLTSFLMGLSHLVTIKYL